MLPLDSRTASYKIATQRVVTQIVTLYKNGAGNNPKVVKLRPGEYWLCRVPNGASGSSVQLLWCKPSDAPLDADMTLPAADAGPKNLDSRDSTQAFILGIDPETDLANEKTAVAVQWDGGADSTLIMERIKN